MGDLRQKPMRRGRMGLELVPVTLTRARQFVVEHHSHNGPPVGWLFGVGVANGHGLVGVAVAGRPVARLLAVGPTVEVTRVCTDGTPNACSMLYGAIWRAAVALGYRKAYTYTLDREAATALRATGWTNEGVTMKAGQSWDSPSRPREQDDLFGGHHRPREAKVRWVKLWPPVGGDTTDG